MAAINFEALTILRGEFIDFDETPDVLVIDGSAEGGLHLVGRGSGDQFWCDYDYNEWHLKFGRIALMEEGEEWKVGHNNWYGSYQRVTLKKIENYDDGRTFLTMEWTKTIEKPDYDEDISVTVIVALTNKEVSDYTVKHCVLHYFVYEMEYLEYEYAQKCEKPYNKYEYDDDEIEIIIEEIDEDSDFYD